MYDPSAPSSVLAIAELKKPGTFDLLRRMAMSKARHEQQADDFVSRSLERVLDPEDRPWRPPVRAFLFHMHVVIREVSYRVNRRKYVRSEIYDGGDAQETSGGDDRVEETVEEKRANETRRILGARLLERMKDDEDALAYYRVAAATDAGAAEIATALKWPVEKVHLVKKRFAYQARGVHQEWQDEEARRMMSLREAAATTQSEGERP